MEALGIADTGNLCYATDDQTVAKTAAQNLPIAATVPPPPSAHP